MASKTLKAEAYEARMALEKAIVLLDGISAAHHVLHSDAESDAPLGPDAIYPFLLVLDGAIKDIMERIETASCVLMALASEENPSGVQGADAYGK